MADTKISALAAVVTPASGDEYAIEQAGTSKKMTLAQIETYLETRGMPRVTRLGTQHSNSTTTPTKVTDLDQVLEAGTYTFYCSVPGHEQGGMTGTLTVK